MNAVDSVNFFVITCGLISIEFVIIAFVELEFFFLFQGYRRIRWLIQIFNFIKTLHVEHFFRTRFLLPMLCISTIKDWQFVYDCMRLKDLEYGTKQKNYRETRGNRTCGLNDKPHIHRTCGFIFLFIVRRTSLKIKTNKWRLRPQQVCWLIHHYNNRY